MQKREKIIVALVIIAIIYGAIDFTLTSRKKKAGLNQAQSASKSAADLTAQLQSISSPDDQKFDLLAISITEPWPEQVFTSGPVNFDTEKKVDDKKTAATNDLRASAEQLVYSGFLSTDSDQIAIINNMDYRVGEQVNGFTITKITKEGIQVRQEEATFDIPAISEQTPPSADKAPPNPEPK